jgi:glycosyltransferase involved in cell wall biosynthesis
MKRAGPILFINNGWYLPAFSGGDLHVMEVAARWARVRDVTIAMPGWAYRLHATRLDGVRLFDTGARELAPPDSFAGTRVRWALRMLRLPRVAPALVVAASQFPFDLIPAILLAKSHRCPLMVYVFHLPSSFRGKGLRAGAAARWEPWAIRLLRHARLLLVDNADVREDLAARGIPPERIQTTWNGTGSPQPIRTEPRRPDEVVYCGRISNRKGWQDLVAVGEHLRDQRPGTRLRVLGEGERRKDLERIIMERGLQDVVATEGFVDEETKWRALQRAAVFISPSREEGWGIAVAEAVEAGAEVVCYDLPAYREVHGDGRLHLVPVGDVETLARRLVQVLDGEATGSHRAAADRLPAQPAPRMWDQIAWHELRLVDEQMAAEGVMETDRIQEVAR